MYLKNPDFEQLRQWSKDEVSYRALLAFLDNQQSNDNALEQLQKAQEIAGVGSWEYYFDTDKSVWSDQFFRICGLEPQSIEPSGETGFSIIHPDDRERAKTAVQNSRQNGTPYNIEKRIVLPDGNIRWVESRGEVEIDQQTGEKKLVGTFLDITERKKVEFALIESESRANTLLDAIPDIVFRISREGEYLDFHGNRDDLLETAESLLNTTIADHFGKTAHDLIVSHIRKTLDTGKMQTFEYRLELQSGWHDFEARTVVNSENDVIAVVRDITETREAERAVELGEIRYESILSAMLEGVIVHDETGKPIVCNDAANEILGISRQTLLYEMDESSYLDTYREDGTLFTIEEYPAFVTLRTGKPQYGVLMGFNHPTKGEMRWVKFNTQPLIREKDDRSYGVVSTFEDVTDELHAEEDRVRALVEQERTRILSQFIQMASHEFRTPLSIINTNLHLIGRLPDAEKRQEKIVRILKQINRLNDLIDMQILMTKLDSGVPMRCTPVALEQFLEIALDKLAHPVEQCDLNIIIDIQPDTLLLNVDAHYFNHAIYQLLNNAVRYSNDCGDITITGRKTDTHHIVSVADNGIGIHAHEIPLIFDRFWRRDKSHSDAGLGLGLAVAKKIIELHDGEISVASTVGEGSVFTILLPH